MNKLKEERRFKVKTGELGVRWSSEIKELDNQIVALIQKWTSDTHKFMTMGSGVSKISLLTVLKYLEKGLNRKKSKVTKKMKELNKVKTSLQK